MDSILELDQSSQLKLALALASGQYQLILGSGASYDSINRHGERPPMARDLANRLCETYGLPNDPDAHLASVFGLVRDRRHPKGESLMAILQDFYTGCRAAEWYSKLVTMPWSAIWTLNIDDVLEDAYNKSYKEHAHKALTSVSWTDRHRVAHSNELLTIHLHGRASAQSPDALVFDMPTYGRVKSHQKRWHHIFADEYLMRPTIVVGARLKEEPDLNDIIRDGRARVVDEGAPPSIIIDPNLTPFDEIRLQNEGLVPVRCDAKKLFDDLHGVYIEARSSILGELENLDTIINPLATAFLTQWTEAKNRPLRTGELDEFYDGHEPDYVQVCHDLSGLRAQSAQIVKDISNDEHTAIAVVVGPPFYGKTVILHQVASELHKKGWKVYSYTGENRPNRNALLWWQTHFPKSIYVIDAAADFAEDISQICALAEKRNTSIKFLLSDRISTSKKFQRLLSRHEGYQNYPVERLIPIEAESLVAKLQENNRLGILRNKSSTRRLSYFVNDHKGELFGALSSLEGGEGFVVRALRQLRAFDEPWQRSLFLAVSIPGAMGHGLPAGIAADVAGVTPGLMFRGLSNHGPLQDLITVRSGKLYPTQKRVGSLLLEKHVKPEERYELIRDLAEALSPQISPVAISNKTLPYRIVRELMDHERLGRFIGNDKVQEWYEEVKDLYSWNSRYWEQRALAACYAGQYPRAVSWAYEAVGIYRDAISLNTVATILMRRGLDTSGPELANYRDYESACEFLQDARDIVHEDSEYPYVTFFNYTLRWVQRSVEFTGSIPEVPRKNWVDWWRRASYATPFQGVVGQETLRNWQHDWLLIATHKQRGNEHY